MEDLVQWLRAQFDAEAAEAHAAAEELGAEWSYDGHAVIARRESDLVAVGSQDFMEPERGVHIARHDPARVLREVDAKRQLLDLLPELEQADRLIAGEWGSSDGLADKLRDALLAAFPKCGATAVFWPEDEACDAECMLPRGHGGTRHEDETVGSWDEADLNTNYPHE